MVENGDKAKRLPFYGSLESFFKCESRCVRTSENRVLFKGGSLVYRPGHIIELRHHGIAVLTALDILSPDRIDAFQLGAVKCGWFGNNVHTATTQKARSEFMNLSQCDILLNVLINEDENLILDDALPDSLEEVIVTFVVLDVAQNPTADSGNYEHAMGIESGSHLKGYLFAIDLQSHTVKQKFAVDVHTKWVCVINAQDCNIDKN